MIRIEFIVCFFCTKKKQSLGILVLVVVSIDIDF